MTTAAPLKVLFVCMGNICRSPTAEAVFRELVGERGLESQIAIDSAGTHAYHVGHAPDARASETALSRGLDMGNQRARQVSQADFAEFDYILALDSDNLANLQALAAKAPKGKTAALSRLLDYAQGASVSDVPDPYYGGPGGFERVFDLVENGCRGLLKRIERDIRAADQ